MAQSLLLSDAERVRFADWLEWEADQSDGMAAQMDKLNDGMMRHLAKVHRTEAAAMRLILKRLRDTESMGLSRKDVR
jgi:hypothetical protein